MKIFLNSKIIVQYIGMLQYHNTMHHAFRSLQEEIHQNGSNCIWQVSVWKTPLTILHHFCKSLKMSCYILRGYNHSVMKKKILLGLYKMGAPFQSENHCFLCSIQLLMYYKSEKIFEKCQVTLQQKNVFTSYFLYVGRFYWILSFLCPLSSQVHYRFR